MNHPDPTEGFVVAQDDPGHPGVVLFMVDRRKQKQSFWSNRLTDVFILNTREVATWHASRLKYNKPRALTWGEANASAANNKVLGHG